jgi:hypothetical protein
VINFVYPTLGHDPDLNKATSLRSFTSASSTVTEMDILLLLLAQAINEVQAEGMCCLLSYISGCERLARPATELRRLEMLDREAVFNQSCTGLCRRRRYARQRFFV